MATSKLNEVIQYLRRVALLRDGAGLTDGQLMELYLTRNEEAALGALVRRHGPMVWGVCWRTLRNKHDAEDAFQSTFLVLVRKAASVVPKDRVGNWLYGVAHQTALNARAAATRRRKKERPLTDMPERPPEDQWRDLLPFLDQELSRLPDKYRVTIVLCDLEGKTRKEAAKQLGLPEGTVAGQLARARAMLAKRLARHGLEALGACLAAALSQNAASAGVPPFMVSSTIKAVTLVAAGQTASGVISAKVVALTEGVLKTMFLKQLKAVTAVLLVLGTVLAYGGGRLFTLYSAAAQHCQAPKLPTDHQNGENPGTSKADPPPAQKESVSLPHSYAPAPVQALVSLKEGQLNVRTLAVDFVTPVTKVVDGQNVTSYVVTEKVMITNYDLKDVKISDMKGKRIDAKELPKLLNKEIVALIAKDGIEVDPLHLRLLKEETLLFLLPSPGVQVIFPPSAGPPLPVMPGFPPIPVPISKE
jgi:RNA polymerase sigma factor (sigma-70 family)